LYLTKDGTDVNPKHEVTMRFGLKRSSLSKTEL